jgi:hypothetical protein
MRQVCGFHLELVAVHHFPSAALQMPGRNITEIKFVVFFSLKVSSVLFSIWNKVLTSFSSRFVVFYLK